MNFSHPSIRRHHVHGALLVALLLVVGFMAQKYRPGFSSASSGELEITCSTQRESNPCLAARHGVRGDWISNSENAKQINEDKKPAWIQYTSPEAVIFTGTTLINRGAAHNDILDGHFEFGGNRRYPQEGGIGALENLTEPITFPKPIKSKTIKFVVDKVSSGTVDVGLAVFETFFEEVPPEVKIPGQIRALAVTLLSNGGDTTIEQIESVSLTSLPALPAQDGLYVVEARDGKNAVIEKAWATPMTRDIITEFAPDGSKAASVQMPAARLRIYLPWQASMTTLTLTNTITNIIEDTKKIPEELFE